MKKTVEAQGAIAVDVTQLRGLAEDLHSLAGHNKYAAAISLAADEIERLREEPKGDECGWLIEHSGEILDGVRGQVSWLFVQMKFEGYGAREFGFTHDANKALRFARREDAEAVLAMHLGMAPPEWYSKSYSVTEHMWVDRS